MSADSVYQYGIHAILDASLIGAQQRERVSRRTRSKTRLTGKSRSHLPCRTGEIQWMTPHPAAPIYPRLSGRPSAQTRHLITNEEPNRPWLSTQRIR
jgi:hypothetical protein